ncbi:MAG: hypothetical protein NTY12_01610 [Candidatus Falkowbacteria bacterium]|nr:hypothetical protein [Candidatus Falkowbacteria bacterium]
MFNEFKHILRASILPLVDKIDKTPWYVPLILGILLLVFIFAYLKMRREVDNSSLRVSYFILRNSLTESLLHYKDLVLVLANLNKVVSVGNRLFARKIHDLDVFNLASNLKLYYRRLIADRNVVISSVIYESCKASYLNDKDISPKEVLASTICDLPKTKDVVFLYYIIINEITTPLVFNVQNSSLVVTFMRDDVFEKFYKPADISLFIASLEAVLKEDLYKLEYQDIAEIVESSIENLKLKLLKLNESFE